MTHDHLVAVFSTHEEAARAVQVLTESGIVERNDISVIGKGGHGEPKDSLQIDKENADILEWGKEGAIWGGLMGFLTGAAVFWIPGFGPLIAVGHVLPSIVGAFGGALTFGSVSALIGWFVDIGIEESDAHHYSDLIKEGKLLILVQGNEETVTKAKEALSSLDPDTLRLYNKK
ncbi:MAG: hypothetical protein L3J47_05135 [Sulfurovum sp.]|nr:hypothetical protein [Sulfurovum sp.]